MSKAQRTRLLRWLYAYLWLLYCMACRESFNLYYAEEHPTFSGNSSIVAYLFKLKNRVNDKLGKPRLVASQLRAVCEQDHGEKLCWENKGGASEYYWQSFWVQMYCLAFNYPHVIDITVERDRIVSRAMVQLMQSMSKIVIPSPTYDIERLEIPTEPFATRAEAVEFVHQWEVASGRQRRDSMFGNTMADVVDHFERIYRSRPH